jgi:hypothetical protein
MIGVSHMRFKNDSIIACIVLALVAMSFLLIFIQPAIAQAPNFPNNTCADCHRRLLFASEPQRQFIEIRIKHLENGISCSIVCHEDQLNKTTSSTYALWSISTHFLFGVTCDKCHGGNASAISKEDAHVGLSNASIARADTPEMCGKCHSSQLSEFKTSKHFQILESSGEMLPAPACITCHQAHSVHVLTASEIEDFCSNCHNNITGINPAVPKRAEAALSSVNELQVEISKAQSDIVSANASGKDVTQAQEELDAARTILKNTPSVWHRFNLTYFETEVQRGIDDAKNAENITAQSQATPLPTKAPGFEGILLISGLVIAYFLFNRRNSR